MNEKQKLLNLLGEKKEIIAEMRKANDDDKQDAFDAAREKLTALNEKIERLQAIVKAEESQPVDEQKPNDQETPTNPAPRKVKDGLRAFCQAIRAKSRGDIMEFIEQAKIVNELNETAPEKGGMTVPEDLRTKINELKRALNPLSRLFNVEKVSRLKGERVIDNAPTKGFTEVSEYGKIPKDDEPTFRTIDYAVKKYSLIVPITEELLEDSDENLLAYLRRWFAKKAVITENKILLELLSSGADSSAVTAAKSEELAAIKTALNATLDPAISLTSSFLTNQNGFNYLDTLEDKNGRPLLQPDPTNGTAKMLLARPIHVMSNAVLPDLTGGAPLYIGDLKQYGTLFRRKDLEITSTREGGDAWMTDSTEVRGIMRLGASIYDGEAVTAIALSTASDS